MMKIGYYEKTLSEYFGKEMEKKREQKLKINRLMYEKVKIIYERLCRSEIMELVELITDERLLEQKRQYRNNRAKSLKAMLRKGRIDQKSLKEHFPFSRVSKLFMNNQAVFDEDAFFHEDVESFRQRVDRYVNYMRRESVGMDLSYKYIYMFDHSESEEVNHNVNNLVCYEVTYTKANNLEFKDGLEIVVTPPDVKRNREIYEGTVKKKGNRIVVVFENSYDSVHLIFNVSLAISSTNPLFDGNYYGLAIGIDDQNLQTPVAKKVVFSKKKFNDNEKAKLYLILNETQVLEAKENIYALESTECIDADHLRKYQKKIKDIHTFFSNVKYSEEIDTSIMHHMVFTEFHVFQSMFEKFAMKQDYFLHDRKRVCLEFIRYLEFHPREKVQMVFPLYGGEANVLLDQIPGKKSIATLFTELAKRGHQFEIVFVIETTTDYTDEDMQKLFSRFHEAGIELYFVAKREIEFVVGSYDFCCTQSGIDAIFKSRTHYRQMFTITRNSEKIKTLRSDFQKIKALAYSYELVQSGRDVVSIKSPVLEKLVGTWYLYFYGSFAGRDGVPVFWEIALEIKEDCSVVENAPTNRVDSGKVEIYPHQSLLSLISTQTANTLYAVVTNNKISDIMSVMLYSKQDQRNLDMAMIGIASREKLMKEEAQILLGDPHKTTLKVDPLLQIRIDEFILAHKTSALIQLK